MKKKELILGERTKDLVLLVLELSPVVVCALTKPHPPSC